MNGSLCHKQTPLRPIANARFWVGSGHSAFGDQIVSLVSDTVRKWDARTVTEKLETAVGRDLQFIRINRTIIGGMVGVAIHAISIAP